MDKQYSGYTLVEMMVVIAIMGFIATIGFYALKNQDKSQVVINAQRDFLNNMRSVQNKVETGADGLALRTINVPTDVSLPTGVSITTPAVTLCFANRNLSSITCGGCAAGIYFACRSNVAISSGYVDVTFSNGTTFKTVRIEGDGMNIGRIYERN